MDKKYWKIGTGAISFVKRFAQITSKGYITGTKVSLFKDENNINFVNDRGDIIYSFTSKSTANQYFVVWEALGFVCKVGNFYVINTNLTSTYDLINLSKIYLKMNSNSKKIERYRETIAINVLFHIGTINIEDLKKMNYSKTRGQLTKKDILKSISKYEKELGEDLKLVNFLREKYDK